MNTRNLTVMFTDLKGYTETTSQQSRDETSRLLKRLEKLLVPIFRAFDGRIVKTIGDAFLVVFDSPTTAVQCGMALQDELHARRREQADPEPIHIRVALCVGEVLVSRGDVFGEPVNVAARVEGITPADEIYLTESVFLTMNRSEVSAESVGDFELKGIPRPVTVYRVTPAEAAAPSPEDPPGETTRKLVVFPFGGTHLSRARQRRMSPRIKLALVTILVLGLLGGSVAFALPGYLRERQWERLEARIGRGETAVARAELDTLEPTEAEASRLFEVQLQLGTRMTERAEFTRAVSLAVSMEPVGPEGPTRLARLRHNLVSALLREDQLELAAEVLDAEGLGAANPRQVQASRRQLARALLEKGRIDALLAQVDQLLVTDANDPQALVLRGHGLLARSLTAGPPETVREGLEAYATALGRELSVGDDPRLVNNVGQAYNNRESSPTIQRELARAADELVARFLGRRAVEALAVELSRDDATPIGRELLAARLQALGAEEDVDRDLLLARELKAQPCTGASATAARALIEQIGAEGGDRSVGALLTYAQHNKPCAEDALLAVGRLVGETVDFVTPEEKSGRERLDALATARCSKPAEVEKTRAHIAEAVAQGDGRAVGFLARLAARSSACAGPALEGIRTLVGRRMAFESEREAETRDVLRGLSRANCRTKAEAVEALAIINRVDKLRDDRAVADLLRLARRKRCADDALGAARRIVGVSALTLSCVSEPLATVRATACRGRAGKKALTDAFEALVKTGEREAVGDLLVLARKSPACRSEALDAARTLTRSDELSLACEAPPPCPEKTCPDCPVCETPSPPAPKAGAKKRPRRRAR